MLMEVFMRQPVPHSPPRASAPLPLTLPLCCSERCSVRVRVMSSTLDAPYTWGEMRKELTDHWCPCPWLPRTFRTLPARKGLGQATGELSAPNPRPLSK